MPDQRKKRWLIALLLVLAFLAPTSIAAISYYTFSGEHRDEICTPYSTYGSDNSDLALLTNFKSVGTVRIASWNGLFSNSNGRIADGVREILLQSDILGLQEMGRAHHQTIAHAATGFTMTSSKGSIPILWRTAKFDLIGQGYVPVFGKERVELGASGVYLGPRGLQWVRLRVKSTGSIITVINNHIVPTIESSGRPNGKSRRLALMDRQFNALGHYIDKFDDRGPVFVTGDFNINAEKDTRVKSSRLAYIKMRVMGLASNWGYLGFPSQGTAGDRYIDYVWSTNTTAAKAVAQKILPGHGSDHKPVLVTYKGEAAQSNNTGKPGVSVASFSNSYSGTGDARVVTINANTSTSGGTPPADYATDTSRGVTLNKRTLWMLETAEKLFGQEVKLSQGSYHHSRLSGDTHEGGGALDVIVDGYSQNERNHLVKAFRQAGFAAWLRTPAEGFDYHLHAIAIGDKQLSPGAQSQVTDYFKGYDGLWHDGRKVRDTGASIGRPIPNWALQYGSRTSAGQAPAFNDITGKSYDSGDPVKGTLQITSKRYRLLTDILTVVYNMKELRDEDKDRAAAAAVTAAWIETDIANDPSPDRYGSVGLFQQIQRYYGAAKQLLQPKLATEYFLKGNSKIGKVGLIYVRDWQNRPIGEVIQAVQKSAPNDYHKVAATAEAIVKDMKGNVDSLDSSGESRECSGVDGSGESQTSGECQTTPVAIPGETSLSMGHVVDDARLMVQCVAGFFPDGFSYGTYNGTTVKEDVSHPTGRAVDIMVANWDTKNGNSRGWELARWLRAHKRELGIHIVIYDRKIWNDERNDEGWRDYTLGSDPSSQHRNHVHVETWGNKAACKSVATCLSNSSGQSSGEWQAPLSGNPGITSPFGMRLHPVYHVYKLHDGDDYDATTGTRIRAIADGIVESAGPAGAYGNYVTISHLGGKVISGYAHMSRIAVDKGDRVKKGQVIGYVGSSGAVTGAHLHANVRVKGYYNPICPSGGGSKCNSHDDWVDFSDFVANKDGIRDKLIRNPGALVT